MLSRENVILSGLSKTILYKYIMFEERSGRRQKSETSGSDKTLLNKTLCDLGYRRNETGNVHKTPESQQQYDLFFFKICMTIV